MTKFNGSVLLWSDNLPVAAAQSHLAPTHPLKKYFMRRYCAGFVQPAQHTYSICLFVDRQPSQIQGRSSNIGACNGLIINASARKMLGNRNRNRNRNAQRPTPTPTPTPPTPTPTPTPTTISRHFSSVMTTQHGLRGSDHSSREPKFNYWDAKSCILSKVRIDLIVNPAACTYDGHRT
jgi:hypothetical protein